MPRRLAVRGIARQNLANALFKAQSGRTVACPRAFRAPGLAKRYALLVANRMALAPALGPMGSVRTSLVGTPDLPSGTAYRFYAICESLLRRGGFYLV